MDDSFELLLAEYLDGDSTSDTVARLCDLIKSSPERQARFREEMRLHTLLWEIESESVTAQQATLRPGPAKLRTSRLRVVSGLMAMAASLAVVVGGWWLAQSRQPAGLGLKVVEVSGEANIQHSTPNTQHSSGERVVTGMELRQGDRVVVAQGGKIGLKYDSEETTIGLVGTATFEKREGGKFVRLEPGRFTCSAAPQAKPFRIQSPHALATVVGTRFDIEVFDAKTALAVSEGKVQFERDGQTLLVGSNQTAEASDQGLKMLPPAVAAVPSGAPRAISATVIRNVDLPQEAWNLEGIAFDGSVLWGCRNVLGPQGGAVSKLFKLDSVSGKVLGTVDVSACVQRAIRLDWDGVNFWIGDGPARIGNVVDKVVAVNPATGRAVKTLNLPSDFYLQGLAVGDGYLWVGGAQTEGAGKETKLLWRGVRKLDLSSGALVASWTVPPDVNEVKGLAYVNGALWMAAVALEKDAVTRWPYRPMVLKLNPADGSVLGSLDMSFVPKTVTTGIECLAKSGTAGQMWMATPLSVYLVEVGEDK